MSTVGEVKQAVEKLSPEEKAELFNWLSGRTDFKEHRLQELRQEIGVGIAQADEGDLAELDLDAVKKEAKQRIG